MRREEERVYTTTPAPESRRRDRRLRFGFMAACGVAALLAATAATARAGTYRVDECNVDNGSFFAGAPDAIYFNNSSYYTLNRCTEAYTGAAHGLELWTNPGTYSVY